MLKMLNDNVLIKEIKEENKFGIPTDSLSFKAEVYNIGPDVREVDIGDIVYLSKYGGKPYKDYLIVSEYDIVGKDA